MCFIIFYPKENNANKTHIKKMYNKKFTLQKETPNKKKFKQNNCVNY